MTVYRMNGTPIAATCRPSAEKSSPWAEAQVKWFDENPDRNFRWISADETALAEISRLGCLIAVYDDVASGDKSTEEGFTLGLNPVLVVSRRGPLASILFPDFTVLPVSIEHQEAGGATLWHANDIAYRTGRSLRSVYSELRSRANGRALGHVRDGAIRI